MSSEKTDQDLQFDKAEFDAPTLGIACASCKNELTQQYFSVNSQSLCAGCTETVRTTLNRKSGAKEILKSILFGLGAAIAGFIIYFAVLKITGYEIGLIAILVGYMVGKAVMIGSDYRGGIKYSVIAVLLTYISIVSTYVPLIIEEMRKQDLQTAAAASTVPGTLVPGAKPGSKAEAVKKILPAKSAAAQSPAGEGTQTTQADVRERPGLGALLLGLAVFAGYVLMLPFLAGFSNFVGLIIIGFALFEAARRTAKPKVTIAGPFEIGDAMRSAAQDMKNV